MRFILTTGEEAVAIIADRLVSELASNKRVLWLLSGGSNIALEKQIMDQVPEQPSQNLSIMLLDERYGPVGHADSNWQQLIPVNFSPKQAKLFPVLKEGLDFAANTSYFNDVAHQAFASNDIIIGQIGMGPDGHIAGILPNSEAVEETSDFVIGYSAPPHQRLTLTFSALKRLTTAYVLAFGSNKLEALTKLQNEELPVSEQPAQFLKSLADVYVYNDQVGDD